MAEVYTDLESAFTRGKKRPGFARLLSDVASGAYDIVLVWKLDRVTREGLRALGRLLDVLDEGDARLVSVTEGLDTSTAMGEMIAGILASIARQESENIGLRVKSARDYEANHGRPHSGGKRRFGYTRAMEIEPAEAQAVRDASQVLLTGGPVTALARQWNAEGILTSEGNTWSVGNLVRTLRSPHLAGLRVHGGENRPGTWEPILSQEVHAELVEVLSRRKRGSVARSYLLSGGLARCGREGCGEPLVAHPSRNGRNYWCPTLPGYPGCGRLSVVAQPLEDLVVERALRRLAGPQTELVLHDTSGRAREALGEVEALETRREALAASFATGRLSVEAYELATRSVAGEMAQAQARYARLRHRDALAGVPVGGGIGALRAWWNGAGFEQRRAVLVAVVERVAIAPAGPGRRQFDDSRARIEWADRQP